MVSIYFIRTSQLLNSLDSDVMMPGMNGPELLAKLREEKKTKLVPVIFVTASDDGQPPSSISKLY